MDDVTLMDIAQTDVVTADREAGVSDVLGMMHDHEVGSVVIVEDDRPTGIVTDRMIAMAMHEMDSISDAEISEIMTQELTTIEEDRTHFDALQTMGDEGIRRLPIVDDDGSLTGIIAFDDLIMVLGAEMSHASDVVEQQSPRR